MHHFPLILENARAPSSLRMSCFGGLHAHRALLWISDVWCCGWTFIWIYPRRKTPYGFVWDGELCGHSEGGIPHHIWVTLMSSESLPGSWIGNISYALNIFVQTLSNPFLILGVLIRLNARFVQIWSSFCEDLELSCWFTAISNAN